MTYNVFGGTLNPAQSNQSPPPKCGLRMMLAKDYTCGN